VDEMVMDTLMGGLPIDADAFWAWLLAQKEGAVVGKSTSVRNCPLACFLNGLGDGKLYMIGVGSCLIYDVSHLVFLGEYTPPAWADRFIALVDGRHEYGADVLREAALAALGQALQEMGI
jgi:hypothetical protein